MLCKITSHSVHCPDKEAAILKNLQWKAGIGAEANRVEWEFTNGTAIFRSFRLEREKRNTSEDSIFSGNFLVEWAVPFEFPTGIFGFCWQMVNAQVVFSVFTHVTNALTTVTIRHVGVQTNTLKLIVRGKSWWFFAYSWIAMQEAGEIKMFPSLEWLQLISNHGEEAEELSLQRRTRGIAAISRDDLTEQILNQSATVVTRGYARYRNSLKLAGWSFLYALVCSVI